MKKGANKTMILCGLLLGLLPLGLMTGMPSVVVAEDIVVIANEAFPTDSIDSLDVMEIYNGTYSIYKKSKIHPLDQEDDQKIKQIFLDKVLRFTPDAYRVHWLKWTFKTGRHPPIVMQDSKEVIQTVQKEEGGLGYVWDHEVQGVEGIKDLLRIPVN